MERTECGGSFPASAGSVSRMECQLTGPDDAGPYPKRNMADVIPIRHCSRLMIVSPQGRLLLFRYSDEHSNPFWATVGGELVGGESYVEAAIRELQEETGFDAHIGPLLRERDAVYAVARSKPARWLEQYFLVSVDAEESPIRENWTKEECSTIVDNRWWSLTELADPSLSLKPYWIPELLTEVLTEPDTSVG